MISALFATQEMRAQYCKSSRLEPRVILDPNYPESDQHFGRRKSAHVCGILSPFALAVPGPTWVLLKNWPPSMKVKKMKFL